MKQSFVMAIDQGTTGTRCILYDKNANPKATSYLEFRQFYPRPGWVEHDADQIFQTTLKVIASSLQKARINSSQIASIGITNQRETTVLWDKKTGRPVAPAIVWQDRRTSTFCETLKKRGLEANVRKKTGLVLDPYFSASKINWLLSKSSSLKKRAKAGNILFGTIDAWLMWQLTGGQTHATDFTNASRTLLFNIHKKVWDPDLLKLFGVPAEMLPLVENSGSFFGETKKVGPLKSGVPIYAVMGDQQAALYGQSCFKKGDVKNTYGTGCFVVMNAGKKSISVPHGLLATLACDEKGAPVYALEGSIFIAGAAIQWLRDGLEFFREAKETAKIIQGLKDSGGVTVIPAFVGLGSPYWNPDVRGTIAGLTRGTTKAHIVRATLESLAHQSADVIEQMQRNVKQVVRQLKVDGGATANPFLMQFQADLLRASVQVSSIQESTAWGAAKLAGKTSGFWTSSSALEKKTRYKVYKPKMSTSKARALRGEWQKQVKHLLQSV